MEGIEFALKWAAAKDDVAPIEILYYGGACSKVHEICETTSLSSRIWQQLRKGMTQGAQLKSSRSTALFATLGQRNMLK